MPTNEIIIQGLIDLHLAGKGGKEATAQLKSIIEQARLIKKDLGVTDDAIGKTSKQVGGLDRAFGKLGATVASYFAARTIINFLQDSYVGFARTERQALATEAQIKALGQTATGAGFREFINQLSDTTKILDDDLVPAFQKAFGAFKDYAAATEIVTLASKFAANGIGDVQSNVEALSNFLLTGSGRSLTRFNIDIKDSVDGTIDLNDGMRALRETARTLGDGFADAQSDIDAARKGWDDIGDAIGGAFGKLVKFLKETKKLGDEQHLQLLKENRDRLSQDDRTALDAKLAAIDREEQARVDAFFNSETTLEAAGRIAAEKQLERDKIEAARKAAEALKAEQARLEKVRDMNQDFAEVILEDRIAAEREGSKARIDLEIELLEKQRAFALENAKKINADRSLIDSLFNSRAAATRRRLKPQTKAQFSDFPDVINQFLDERQALIETLKDERRIRVDAEIEILALRRDLTLEGTKARFEAEREIELAALDARLKTFAENETLSQELRTRIAQAGARAREHLVQQEYDHYRTWDELDKKQKIARAFQFADVSAQIAGLVFENNKAAAVATAVVDTARAVVSVLPNFALAALVAAAGALQIQKILAARIGSASTSGPGIAANPTSASPPQGASVRAPESLVPSIPSSSGPSIVIQSRYNFNDPQGIRRVTRDIQREIRNQQGSLS